MPAIRENHQHAPRFVCTVMHGAAIWMDDAVIDAVTRKWPGLGLPGSGKPIWK